MALRRNQNDFSMASVEDVDDVKGRLIQFHPQIFQRRHSYRQDGIGSNESVNDNSRRRYSSIHSSSRTWANMQKSNTPTMTSSMPRNEKRIQWGYALHCIGFGVGTYGKISLLYRIGSKTFFSGISERFSERFSSKCFSEIWKYFRTGQYFFLGFEKNSWVR